MIIPMLCVTIFVILVVWFLLPRVARLMIHTPTAISIFVCLSMVQLMAVFISMRCTLCGHFLQVALTLILVVGYAIADRKSGSAGMPRPISYAVFCLKKKKKIFTYDNFYFYFDILSSRSCRSFVRYFSVRYLHASIIAGRSSLGMGR